MEENKQDLMVSQEEPEEEETVSEPLPEALFRVKTVLNAQTQEEASNTVRGKILDLITWFFMAICLGFAALMLWQYFTAEAPSQSHLIFSIIMIAAVLFALYNKLFGGKKALKRWEATLQQQYGTSALHLTTEFYPLSMSQSLDESENVLVEGYSSISAMKESENLFLLSCGGRQWFFVAKNGFVLGDPEEFRKFISEKIGG